MFTVLVPFYNEEKNLPQLVKSFRKQIDQNFSVTFVDNNSNDNSTVYIKNLPEVKGENWYYTKEIQKGLWAAIKNGIEYIDSNSISKYIYRIDSDSVIDSLTWSQDVNILLSKVKNNLGYFYGPFEYTDFDNLPTFNQAYQIYNKTLTEIMQQVGWFGTGTNALFSLSTIKKISRKFSKNKLSEEDLKIGLFLNFNKKKNYFVNHNVKSSGRNIIKDLQTFHKWCFYDDDFYSQKWNKKEIQKISKTKDLNKFELNRFFYRRSLKLATRNLLPLIIFDQNNQISLKIQKYLDIKINFTRIFNKYRNPELINLLLDETEYEILIKQIAKEKITTIIAKNIAEKMIYKYNFQSNRPHSKSNFYHLNG